MIDRSLLIAWIEDGIGRERRQHSEYEAVMNRIEAGERVELTYGYVEAIAGGLIKFGGSERFETERTEDSS